MNKTIRFVLLSASFAAASYAAPFMAVGDGAELFATGALGVRADDNILLSKNATSDVIFDVTPGLELDFGKNSQLQGVLSLGDVFSMYTDHSNLNTNLFSGDFVSKYDDSKTKMGFNAGYHELNQNTADVRGTNGRLVRRNVASVGANGEVGVSEITAVGAAVNYQSEKYHPKDYVDSDILTVPINFYYKWTPKIDLSLGYQYRDYQVKKQAIGYVTPDSTDHFFSIGARGEFTPVLTGKLAVGYAERHYSSLLQNRSLFGIDSSFAYEFTPKTTLQFGVSNAFDTSPQGVQQKNFTINTLVVTKLSEEWSVNGGISYRRIGYDTRTDNYWEGKLGAAYTVNANLSLAGAYVYRTYKSDISTSEFDNNVFSVSANLRY